MKWFFDLFRHKKQKKSKPEPAGSGFIPSTEDVAGVVVSERVLPFVEPFPLPRREGDVWVLTGTETVLSLTTADRIRKNLSGKGYTLRLYEEVFENITPETLSYNFPGRDYSVEMLSRNRFNLAVCRGLGLERKEGAILFIRYAGEPGFAVYDPEASGARELLVRAYAYGEYLPVCKNKEEESSSDGTGRLYRREEPQEPFEAQLPPEGDEAYGAIDKLILKGYSIDVIDLLLNKFAKPYRLYITERLGIHLENRSGREIRIREKEKALYLFLLWNDREFFPYQLESHEDEIYSIYERIARRGDPEELKKTVNRLVTVKSAFMDARHAIKEAFEAAVPNRAASFYIIRGDQNYAKKIDLDRSLVTWEKPLFPNGR